MKVLFGRKSLVRLALASLLFATVAIAVAPTSQAQSREDKHARKVHKKLAKYPAGRYLHLVLSNGTNDYGALGTISDASFTFKSADTNATTTISYSDVDKIKTDRQAIGAGTAPHRYIRPRTYVILGAITAGAIVAAFEVPR